MYYEITIRLQVIHKAFNYVWMLKQIRVFSQTGCHLGLESLKEQNLFQRREDKKVQLKSQCAVFISVTVVFFITKLKSRTAVSCTANTCVYPQV